MDKITRKLEALPPEFQWFSLEFFPPKTAAGLDNLHPRISRLSKLQPLFVTVTWGAGGSTSTRSLELAEICQQQYGLTTCLHLTCTNMKRRILDNALQRCKDIGIRNLLALRGDESREQEYDMSGVNGFQDDIEDDEDDVEFRYALDLIRYIRKKHGDYFCIGVAGYPEGHSASPYDPNQSPLNDLPFLREKTKAGADFIMTQLVFDVNAFLNYRAMLRSDESGLFKTIPILPGLMPVQSWQSVVRTIKLCCASMPADMRQRLADRKGDDEQVKKQGVLELKKMIKHIHEDEDAPDTRQGYHFYTLNLERVVAQILSETGLVPSPDFYRTLEDEASDLGPSREDVNDRSVGSSRRRRLSSKNAGPHNRVVVTKSADPSNAESPFDAPDDEAGIPSESPQSSANALATSEGYGSLGREATWDDYPNGRFGDSRSPAYGAIDGYGPSLHVSAATALSIWGQPETRDDIGTLFTRYLSEKLSGIPWSEEPLSQETTLIRTQLLALVNRGWWPLASQPPVNCASSADPIVGWGPSAGHVWQKPFVELFLPKAEWQTLKSKLDSTIDEFIYFAGDENTSTLESNEPDSVNGVTWGAFRGKEIRTPTVIGGPSFHAWCEEAFILWALWGQIYPRGSPSARLMEGLKRDLMLVCVIGNEFMDGGERFWKMLLE